MGMANGGSITKRGKALWEVSYNKGKEDGKYVRVSRRVHGTKKEAIAALDELRQLDNGIEVPEVAFGEFAAEWLAAREMSGDFAAATVADWKRAITQLSAVLGDTPLSHITPRMVEGVYRGLKETRHQSGTTLNHTHKVLKQIMQRAVDYGLVGSNPVGRVTAPRREAVDRRSLDGGEYSDLVRTLDGMPATSCTMAVRIGLATGMRRGEVLALTWRDVDLDAARIRISRSLGPGRVLRDTKTAAGRRTVALDARTVEVMRKWRETQETRLSGPLSLSRDTPVVTDAKGGYMDPNNFSRWWRRFAKDIGQEGLRFHELRHTQASLLLAAGTDIKTVQARLGHASPSVTMGFYAHAMPGRDEMAAKTLEKIVQIGTVG